VRAVLDASVLISGVLSSSGAAAELLRSTRDRAFELIVSRLLLAELDRAFGYPRLRKRIPREKTAAFIGWLHDHATVAEDPAAPPAITSPDPDDDYLRALAISQRAFLVTGDQHLLSLRDELPTHPPAEFLQRLVQVG
jgi:putative PIN family toxin of toxin-antitoxin system